MGYKVKYIAQLCDSDTDQIIQEKEIKIKDLLFPKTFHEFGLRHKEQVELIKSAQDFFLEFQCNFFAEQSSCPQCGKNTKKQGKFTSEFHDVYTDHRVSVQRMACSCGWQSDHSIKSIYGSASHPELVKLQVKDSSETSFDKASKHLNNMCCGERKVNNHATLINNVNKVGALLEEIKYTDTWSCADKIAEQIILNIDGGHVQNKEQGKHSFEELVATAYRPEDLVSISENRKEIKCKVSVASARNDDQKTIKELTKNACSRLGMTKETTITALTDGASNCWPVADYLSPYCKGSVINEVTFAILCCILPINCILQRANKMSKHYRVIFQTYEESSPNDVIKEELILDAQLTLPTNCLDFTMGIETQFNMVRKIQSNVLNEKLAILADQQERHCPIDNCSGKLVKCGKQKSPFHDVFTDHMVSMQRFKCNDCGHETPSTAKMIMGTIQSGELQMIQSKLGATHTYRESEELFSIFSGSDRTINNHDRIKQVTESVGEAIAKISTHEKEVAVAAEARELILNVDGGHIKTTDKDARSIEALASVVYRPEAMQANSKDTRNYLTSKNCAASVLDDNQEQFIYSTIIAALKQGLGNSTHVTALCDGAQNCWNVVDAIAPLAGSVTCILDWFHISMKMNNIALPEHLKTKFLRIKWHLWRGNTENALLRLSQLKTAATDDKVVDKINKFYTYIFNNMERIVDYRARKNKGLVFTSNLAESTVESLINRRCKGQQHMRWSREGLDPLLQIRAALNSKGEWESKWKTAILNAA